MSEGNGTKPITFPLGAVQAFSMDVQSIFTLQPPPAPRGKYWLAKISQFLSAEIPHYQQEKLDLLRKHAAKDDKGEPVLRVVDKGNGQQEINIDPVDRAAFVKDDGELYNTPVTIPGVPMLSHADLGDCPIPQGAYTRLLGTVILDEGPPA